MKIKQRMSTRGGGEKNTSFTCFIGIKESNLLFQHSLEDEPLHRGVHAVHGDVVDEVTHELKRSAETCNRGRVTVWTTQNNWGYYYATTSTLMLLWLVTCVCGYSKLIIIIVIIRTHCNYIRSICHWGWAAVTFYWSWSKSQLKNSSFPRCVS